MLFVWAVRIAAITQAGCLVPVEGIRVEERVNFLPEVDRTAQRPRDNIIVLPFDCPKFDVASRARDLNDEVINYRFVANAEFDDAKIADEGSLDPDVGRFDSVRAAIQIQVDFPALYRRANPVGNPAPRDQVGVLSLFLTDSPTWLIPAEEADVNTIGLGDIPPAALDGGLEPYGVTEIRWTFLVEARADTGLGECPQ